MKLVWALLLALTAPSPEEGGPLPSEPEVRQVDGQSGDLLFDVRGRDAPASKFLALLDEHPKLRVEIEPGAALPLRTTRLTVDLRAREPDWIVDLIGAATGVEVRPLDPGRSFRMLAPPPPDMPRPREELRRAAVRFYELALLRQRDAATAALALRGLGDLHRVSGDYVQAYTAYETLLSRFAHSPAAANAELLLAECFARIGDGLRARKVLTSYLDRTRDPTLRELALRRLLALLLDEGRFLDIEALRDPLARLPRLGPETLDLLAEAGSRLLRSGEPEAAVLLLEELWRKDPKGHAALGPVLGRALLARGDGAEASRVLSASVRALEGVLDKPSSLMSLALLAEEAGEPATALLLARRVLGLEGADGSDRIEAHALLARLYQAFGLHVRARAHLQAVESLGAREEAARLVLRSAHYALEEGRTELARLLFQEAAAEPTTRLEALLGAARALAEGGDVERALKLVGDLVADGDVPHEVRERARRLHVELLEEAGRFAEALERLRTYWPDVTEPAAEEES